MAVPRRIFRSDSELATEQLAEQIGAMVWPGAVLALDGELGAGKTAFVRGLARGLGVDEPISSPTYTLMHEYTGRLPLYHFDAWMTGRETAFFEDGGSEWVGGDGVAVVEWAQRVESWLPVPRLEVVLEHVGPEERRLGCSIRGAGSDSDRYLSLLGALQAGSGLTEIES